MTSADIERLSREVQDKTAELGRLRTEECREAAARARARKPCQVFEQVSTQIEHQRKGTRLSSATRSGLTRLVERLASELARTPSQARGCATSNCRSRAARPGPFASSRVGSNCP